MSKREKWAARRAEKASNPLRRESHREEATRLQVALLAVGVDIPVYAAEGLWMQYSDEQWAAGWMGMPESDADLIKALRGYL